MAYCPEDGKKMNTINDGYNICYDCPECDTHWTYEEGAYYVVNLSEGCANCGDLKLDNPSRAVNAGYGYNLE